jgi:antitoxin ParD1/3/4
MNVNLTPELEAMVRRKVESGLYNNASEVVREALRLMFRDEHERFQRLRAAVTEGFEQAERGETVPYSAELMDRLKREATAAALAGRPIPDEVKP